MIWNFDPEIAMTPTTEAGKAHAEAWTDAVDTDAVDNEWGLEPADRESMLGVVAAIETEAAADERERIAKWLIDGNNLIRKDQVTYRSRGITVGEMLDFLDSVNPEETDHD